MQSEVQKLDLFEACQNVCFNVDTDKYVPSFLIPTENQLLSHLSDDQVVPLDTEALHNHTLSSDEQVDLSVFSVSTSDLLTPDSTQIRSDLKLNSSEATTSVSNEHSNTTTVPDSIITALERKQYWKQDKQIKCKQINLENIIKTLSSPMKSSVIQKVAKNHLKSMEAILAQNNSETKFESMGLFLLIRLTIMKSYRKWLRMVLKMVFIK